MTPFASLRLGVLLSAGMLGFAAVVGLVAVVDTDTAAAAGIGFAIAAVVFLAGATMSCSLACLGRERLRYPSLAGIAVAGLAIDLSTLAIWQEIESEAYGKTVAIAFVWSLIALLVLGLTLAVGNPGAHARYAYLAAVGAAAAAGLIATWLIATSGDENTAYEAFGTPVDLLGNDGLLRGLGAALVLVAALWFVALAASRLDRATR
jgi:hypothetical protein